MSINISWSRLSVLLLVVCFVTEAVWSQPTRNGKRFDPGLTMTEGGANAAPDQAAMAYVLGQWDVTYTSYPADTTQHTASGWSRFSYLNRGHGFMEELHVPDFDGAGHELNTIGFLALNTFTNQWNFGEVNSFTEGVTIYDGTVDGNQLVLRNAIRRGGGVQVTMYRMVFEQQGDGAFSQALETSLDYGATWKPHLKKAYTKRAHSDDFMAAADTYGSPAPGLPEEAHEFDFLIGTYTAQQQLTFPNGQQVNFPSITTAVHALNGHAILEFGWYDIDTNLPEAATTIVRIYNRAMRRWESLYIANRGSAMLFFGGDKEGDRIVLHNFESDLASPSISRYVFHSVEENGYKWFSEQSTDRGQTFQTTWTLDMTRRADL